MFLVLIQRQLHGLIDQFRAQSGNVSSLLPRYYVITFSRRVIKSWSSANDP